MEADISRSYNEIKQSNNTYVNTKSSSLLTFTIVCGVLAGLTAIAGCAILAFSIYVYLDPAHQETNQCVMSFMKANYVPLPAISGRNVTEYMQRLNEKYSLYLYREGAESLNNWKALQAKSLTGIPVLFVHGNAGSYKQSRSVGMEVEASALAVESASGKGDKVGGKIDLFALDFNEELSAFSEQLLWDQAWFLNECIETILSQYYGNKYKSVIIVAHSMGGTVSRATLLLDNYKQGSIETIITLSTPHREHPILFDRSIAQFYRHVNSYWKKNVANPNSDISKIAIASVSSGFRDIQVQQYATTLGDIIPPSNGLTVSAYSIPKVGVSSDHLSIVWCNQMVKVVARCLLDIADSSHHSSSLEARMKILKDNFVGRHNETTAEKLGFVSSGLRISDDHELLISPSGPKKEDLVASLIASPLQDLKHTTVETVSGPVLAVHYPAHIDTRKKIYEFKLLEWLSKVQQRQVEDSTQQKAGFALFSNVAANDMRVYARMRGTDVIVDLSHLQISLPHVVTNPKNHVQVETPAGTPQSLLFLKLEKLRDYESVYIDTTHIPKSKTARLFAQLIDERAISTSHVHMPQLLFEGVTILSGDEKSSSSLLAEYHFPNLPKQYAYQVEVLIEDTSPARLSPVAYFISTAASSPDRRTDQNKIEDRFSTGASKFSVKFFSSETTKPGFSVLLFKTPGLKHKLRISVDIKGTLSQFIRFNAAQIVVFVFAILFFAMGRINNKQKSAGLTPSLMVVLFTRVPLAVAAVHLLRYYDPAHLSAALFKLDVAVSTAFSSMIDTVCSKLGLTTTTTTVPQRLLLPTQDFDFEPFYRTGNAFNADLAYVALSAVTAFAVVWVLASVVFAPVLAHVFYVVISLLFPKGLAKWSLLVCSIVLCGLSLTRSVHSAFSLVVSAFYLLSFATTATRQYPRATRFAYSLFVLQLLSSVLLLGAPAVVWVKELIFVVASAKKMERLGIANVIASIVSGNKLLPFSDANRLLVVPMILNVVFSFAISPMAKERKPTALVQFIRRLILEAAAIYTLLFCGFAVYRIIYAVSAAHTALLIVDIVACIKDVPTTTTTASPSRRRINEDEEPKKTR